ncbi:Tad domain-containing protein [Aquibacillus sediminis]|uniref:Tad domain-containing protein n=1 Tax=Aquibacillus sediminis TaxID=2574734 RepID=UPI001108EDB3|nr:Tad domain-containing protein [Aquibacillus sediminis]
MKIVRALLNNESGSALALVTFAFIGLVGITGLVVDGGMLYASKSHLQKVANASVLSGAQELTSDDQLKVRAIIDDILVHHDESDSLQALGIIPNSKVTIELQKPVPLTFSSLFGIETVNISANATASLGVMGRAVGAAPLGVPETTELQYGEEYKLKVDSSDSVSGYFGILALEGPGANLYEDNLRYGFQEPLAVGDVVNTQTGNIAGKTRTVVNELVNSCENYEQRDCPRTLLVLVYKPYNQTSDQLKQVEITGFAHFYITEPMSSTDTSITGIFIKRTNVGYFEPDAVDRGAYTIRLTE